MEKTFLLNDERCQEVTVSSINSEIDLSQEIQKIILDGMEMELKMPPKDTIQNRIKCWLDSTRQYVMTSVL